jgi:MFS family permease
MEGNELIIGLLSFLFTVLVLSYIVGDSPAFRLAVHAFVGVAAGYVAATVFRQVVVDKLFMPLLTGSPIDRVLMVFPLIMSVMLLAKMSPQFEWFGRPVVAFLVGVGTATAVAGAVLGTLFPQVEASSAMFGQGLGRIASGALILLGTITTIAYFQFTVRKANAGNRGKIMAFLALLGQVFIAITLGAIFAGVLAAALTAFVDRIQAIVLFLDSLIPK